MTLFYNPDMLAAEREIAAYVKRLLKSGCQKIEPLLEGDEDEDQVRAILTACQFPLSVIYGRPGSGKTKTTSAIVRSFDKSGLTGIMLAPTGKASKRGNEVINNPSLSALSRPIECMTVHRGLGFSAEKEGFDKDHTNMFDLDYVIGDEWSMADCPLTASFFAAIDPSRTRVVLVGDPYQLPSVGPGNVMNDLINSRVVPRVELTKCHRQGANSGIVQNASRILNGEMPIQKDPITGEAFADFFFVHRNTPEESLKFILESVVHKIPAKYGFDPIFDIQSLSPGKKSDVGTGAINKSLREMLNPAGKKETYGDFRLGDKVINRKNIRKLGIVNGDVGKVIEIGKKGMVVDFGIGAGMDGLGIVTFSDDGDNNGNSLQLAYSFTVHSSQGSEFKAVIMPCHMAHYKLLFRNLIYTGMTRAKNLTCIVGDIKALTHAIETSVTDKRMTGLQNFLRMAA
jgi:exodeoxyribonuclease V alpha subunit